MILPEYCPCRRRCFKFIYYLYTSSWHCQQLAAEQRGTDLSISVKISGVSHLSGLSRLTSGLKRWPQKISDERTVHLKEKPHNVNYFFISVKNKIVSRYLIAEDVISVETYIPSVPNQNAHVVQKAIAKHMKYLYIIATTVLRHTRTSNFRCLKLHEQELTRGSFL
jgi:hypothetical protein